VAARDIAGRDDLEELLRAFYGKAMRDPLLRPVFVDVVRMDLEAHLPVITDFWQKTLLGAGSYAGRPMRLHRRISERVALTRDHFDPWLVLWRDAVTTRFSGPVADEAIAHAQRVAQALLRDLDERPPGRRPLPIAALPAS
jgi:hemoglobin